MDSTNHPELSKEDLIALKVCIVTGYLSLVAVDFFVPSAVFPLIVSLAGIIWLGWPFWKWFFR